LVLAKISKIMLITLDVILLAFVISNLVYGVSPINQPGFWVAAAIEIVLGYLTYRFWMRSILGKEYRHYRRRAFILILIGILLPIILYYSNISFFSSAGITDLFYFITVITLLIYSSFIIKRYLETHKN
jgi:hypothetical protein